MRFESLFGVSIALLLMPLSVHAHEWHQHSDVGHKHSHPGGFRVQRLVASTSHSGYVLTATTQASDDVDTAERPDIARHFEHFKNVKVRWDSDTLYVESDGLPNHNMMIGIRNWQQQVPLPQPFSGSNSWKIPLRPRLSRTPINAKETSFRGAIAVAVNGVPIFSALNNRGDDAYLAGELDNWGGHCGRGDDYHYHVAPLHLQKIVGQGNPIAYALDGFPIYGLTEADGSPVGKLDELNGQLDANGKYHYHATKTYPYINGGVRGVVDFRNGEIASQPRDSPVRPAQRPLRGAVISDFAKSGKQSVLTYRVQGRTGTITYVPVGTDSWKFTYSDPNGSTRTETYQRRSSREDRRGDDRRPPPPRGNRPPPRR